MVKTRIPCGQLVKIKKSDRWYWEYYSKDQKRNLYKSTRTTDRNAAEKIAKKWAVQFLAIRDGWLDGKSASPPIGKVAKEFYQSCIGRLNQKYLREIARYIDDFIFSFFGEDTEIHRIQSHRITEFGTWLLGRGLAAQSANKIISCLSSILKYAARSGWIQDLPYISRLSENREEHGYELSDAEIGTLWHAAEESKDYLQRFVGLCLFCGLRHGEALRVKWEDIDWRRGILHVVQKNRSAMPAPLGRMRTILERVPEADRQGTIVKLKRLSGDQLDIKSVRRSWKTLRKRAGLPDWVRIHDLRHTFVSRMFRLLGYDARFLSRHKSQDAFLRYLHADREKLYERASEAF